MFLSPTDKEVIELEVQMRGEERNALLATYEQIIFLLQMGTPRDEAMRMVRSAATETIARWQRDTGTLKRRYERFRSCGPKTYCSCPHCLGHSVDEAAE